VAAPNKALRTKGGTNLSRGRRTICISIFVPDFPGEVGLIGRSARGNAHE